MVIRFTNLNILTLELKYKISETHVVSNDGKYILIFITILGCFIVMLLTWIQSFCVRARVIPDETNPLQNQEKTLTKMFIKKYLPLEEYSKVKTSD